MKYFPNFNDLLLKRQHKVIVSITSYPQRFVYLPDLMRFIKNQNYFINRTILFIYKDDIGYYNLNIKDLEIILTDLDLKPHKKYFYPMKLFRDNAIITLDDDIGYSNDTVESLVNAYIENPNIISGRRVHLMTFNNNSDLNQYVNWAFQYKFINESDFNLILTNGAGSIFPPDILNINKDFLPIINETITCDDLTLKYFAVRKGIPHKWIVNNNIMGIPRRLPKSESLPLYQINIKNNDICINKLNILVNNIFLNNLCVPYRNLSTGTSIYLYDVHNKNIINNKLIFDIYAYSFCPIDDNLNFTIYLNNITAQCFIKQQKKKFLGNNKKIATCEVNKLNQDIDNFLSAKVYSNDNIKINMPNYRKYLTIIFKNFICEEFNICYLEVLIYENLTFTNYPLRINNKYYSCSLFNRNNFSDEIFPIITKFKCVFLNFSNDTNFTVKNIISGFPPKIKVLNKLIENEIILYEFVIMRITLDNGNKNLIFIGRLLGDLKSDLYNIFLNLIYPKITLYCNLSAFSKYVQSKIFCKINDLNIIDKEILIENQIVRLVNDKSYLVLINEETLIKLNFNKINILENRNNLKKYSTIENIKKKKIIDLKIYISLIIIIIKIKIYFSQ